MQSLSLEGLELVPLEESALLLKYTLRAAQAGSWVWDIPNDQCFWSEEYHHLVGTDLATCRPCSEAWLQTIHPHDRETALREMEASLRERRELKNEFRVVRPDGVVRWMRSQGQTLYDKDGTPLRMMGVMFDITERKQTEEALHQREEDLRIITDGLPVLISYVDSGQRYRFNNRMYEQWFGQKRDEIRGMPVREVLGEAAYQDIRPHIEAALAGREVRFEMWIDYKTVGKVCVEVRYVPDLGPDGGVRGFFALINDITTHKQAQAALRESEERLRLATRAAAVGIWSWNIAANEVFWSPECYTIMGVTDFEGTREDFSRSVHPDDAAGVWKAVQEAVDHRQPYLAEFRILRPDGEVRWLLNHGLVQYEDSGNPSRLLGIVMDITERKQTVERLQESDRRKDEFLATLAHELRNPLAPIRNAVQVMHRLGNLDPQLQRMCDVLDRQTQQLSRLVDDLLDISRIGQGKTVLRIERLDLRTAIERAVEVSRPVIDGNRHRLEVLLPARPLMLDGDEVRLVQVVSNLLNNAAKYTEPGGSIRLAVDAQGGEARIRVEDDGIGMPAEFLPVVFDLFAQADRASDRARGGLGIGLALVRKLAELHGGTVQADSAGLGHGSVFTVRLPLVLPGFSGQFG